MTISTRLTARLTTGLLAAALAATALTGCSTGQSVADACASFQESTDDARSDLNNDLGKDRDASATKVAAYAEAANSALADITNEDILKAAQKIATDADALDTLYTDGADDAALGEANQTLSFSTIALSSHCSK